MNSLLTWFLILTFTIDIASIVVLHRNDLLYSGAELFTKTMFIIVVPIIGGLVVLYQIGKFYRENRGSGDAVKWYAFWEFHGATSGSDGSSSSYSGDSFGGDSGGGGD